MAEPLWKLIPHPDLNIWTNGVYTMTTRKHSVPPIYDERSDAIIALCTGQPPADEPLIVEGA